ncbi:MAG: zinc-ribbon domain-containing protein [Desulfosudaceae bacterium]
MKISCEECGTGFKIADEKLPEGKTVSVRCPQCKTRMSVTGPARQQAPEAKASDAGGAFGFAEVADETKYDASEKPFDFIEEEGETALICESDPPIREAVRNVLDFMEYHISEASDTRDALKKMRYHRYDLVVVNDSFSSRSPDSNGVLIYLERLKMKTRRQMFTVMMTKRFKTMDAMAAFQKSVNLIVNVDDIKHFEKILKRSQSDFDQLYRVFRETQKDLGLL